MKIFFTNNAPIIKYGIGQAFADLGHETCFCNILLEDDWKQQLLSFQPDYVFTDGGWGILEQLMPFLADHNIPHIYWAIEDPPFFDVLSLPFARCSNYVFTTCAETLGRYELQGIKANLLPFACHPAFHRRGMRDAFYKHDIVFIGNNYDNFPERSKAAEYILKPLMDHNFNLKVYGNDWWLDQKRPFSIAPNFYGGYAASEDLPVICASVPIILGLHSVASSTTMLSMRTFEILGCAGFHITQWTPAVENYFKNHYHLVWSKSGEETLDLADFYLKHPEARERIARQGQQEVYKHHTYHHRARRLMSLLKPENANVPKLDPELTRYRVGRRVQIIKGNL